MRRRRFKRRLTWFPPIGTKFSIGDEIRNTGLVTFQVNVLANGDINQIELPLTFDFGTEEIQRFANENVPAITLADLQGSGWQLRRLVGKIHATYQPITEIDFVKNGQDNGSPGCYFAAGFMVRKVSGQASNTAGNVNVLDADDYDDPWIWRRGWVLGQSTNNGIAGSYDQTAVAANHTNRAVGARGFGQQIAFSNFPATNAEYGSVMDGPHVDQKTNRIIGADERLFLHLTTKALPIQPQANYTADTSVIGVFDLRMLGNLRRITNRRNASR